MELLVCASQIWLHYGFLLIHHERLILQSVHLSFFPCRDSEGRKLCKKVKVDPSSKTAGFEILHYK